MSGGDSSAEGAGDRSGRVVALEGEQGYRVLVRSRGTITDSPEHRPHRCLPAAGATTATTARTAATAVVLDGLARVGAGREWGRLERRGGGRSQRAGGCAGGRTRISRVSQVARHDRRLTRAPTPSCFVAIFRPAVGAITTIARTAATRVMLFARGRPLCTLGRGRVC